MGALRYGAMFRRKPAPPPASDRWLVIGLGNPGREYERSRHNVGFLVVDELARRSSTRVTDKAAKSLTGRMRRGEHELVLAKPQTMMNLSGLAAKALRAKYDVPLERTLIVHDDLDHPFGRLRIRKGGSSAGNHGIDSVIGSFGTPDFIRFRVGIGRPPGNGVDYVLSPFTADEQSQLAAIVGRTADAVLFTVEHGLDRAMTEFNRVS
ncbi:MAG: peptidyl-tRNA hydrolase, family [Chloroflexota bacterium]|nr:peptidyl-tRNA hydrolase, family [Chloroflexota bacterium]